MVVVIDLEEEEAKKAAEATKQTTEPASSNESNSKQQPAETKSENLTDKKCQPGASESTDVKGHSGRVGGAEAAAQTAAPVSDVKTTVGESKESSKAAPEPVKSKPADEDTKPKVQTSKSVASESKDKFKDQPAKAPTTEATGGTKKGKEGPVLVAKKVSTSGDKSSSKSKKNDGTSAKDCDKDKDSMEGKKKDVSAESKKKASTELQVTKGSDSSENKKEASSTKPQVTDGSESSENKKESSSTKPQVTKGSDSSENKKESSSTKPQVTDGSESSENKKQASSTKLQVTKGNDSSENKKGEASPTKSEASSTEPQVTKGNDSSESKKKEASSPKVTLSEKTPQSTDVNVGEKKEQKDPGATLKKTESESTVSSSRKEKTRPPTYSSFSSSLKAPNLQSWVKNVRDQLKQNKLDDSVYGRFSKCKTDEERITLLYNIPLVHDVLNVKEFYKGKDEEAAKSLRVQGNAAFQKKEYDAALKLYSDSIVKAPSSGSSELALALANRSAVLYHKQQYVLCLQDIKQAFKHKYPDHLQYKLYERRGKACYCLRLKEDANCAFQDAINVLDKTQLDEKKLATVKMDLTKQLQKCSKLVSVESVKAARDFNHNHGPIPVIKDSRSAHIPCMGNSLVMKTSDSSGRGLYATRNIEVGEVLIIEKPYSSVTLPDHNLTHCHHCCNRVLCPLPCHQCSGVVFCSEECQQTAWESYHYAECKYHDLIQQAELGMGHLALRMVLKAGYKYLREYRNRVDSRPTDPLLLGCNGDGIYDSSDYHSVYNLVAHTKDRSSADLFRRALGSVFMLKCIENSGFFARVEGDDNYDQEEEKVYIGGHILRHTQMLPCNAHEVSEFVFKTYSIQMSEPEEVGSAIYSTLSLINHSCDPSVVRHSYGNECVVRAIRNISKGEEIVDNYGTLYPVMSKPMRQEKLLSQYYFICSCHACACNWPMYEKIRREVPVLKCKKCKIGRIMIPADNHTTRAICEDCREVTDITPDLLHLSKSEGFYQGCLDKVLKGEELNEGLPYLVDHLRLIDRLLIRPWKDYNDCQEAIKQCYSAMANCQVLEEPDSDDEELLESERRRRP